MSRFFLSILVLLATIGVALVLLANHYLLPALLAASLIDEAGQRQLAALARLLLAILLVALLFATILVVHPSRFFLPGKSRPRTVTRYRDAWAESAERLPTPPPDEN